MRQGLWREGNLIIIDGGWVVKGRYAVAAIRQQRNDSAHECVTALIARLEPS